MARAQKEPLRAVTAEEQAALARIAQASSERVDRARRAAALLAVAAGQPYAQAARQAGFTSGTAVAGNGLQNRNWSSCLPSILPPLNRSAGQTYMVSRRERIVHAGVTDLWRSV